MVTNKRSTKPRSKSGSKSRAAAPSLAWSLPEELDRIEDVRIEQRILFNAPWDLTPLQPSRDMTPVFLVQLGAACFRRGEFGAAESAWATIPVGEELADSIRPWRALALARRGEFRPALELVGEGEHLRGEILCALGQFDAGLAIIGACRDADPMAEWRSLREAAWMRRAGRAREAGKRIEARLKKVARFGLRLEVEAIRAWLAAGEPEKARPHHKSIQRSAPGLARALLGQSLSGLDWLPHGLEALAREVHGRGLDVYFLDRETASLHEKDIPTGKSAPRGVLPGPTTWAALAEGTQYVVVAESSVRTSRNPMTGASVALWLVHPERPGKLYLCLSERIPAFLWPELDATVEDLSRWHELVGEHLVVDEPRLSDFTRRLRLFIGGSAVPSPYTGELEELDFDTFSRVSVSSPFLETYPWGGAHDEDPHRYFVDRGGLDGLFAHQKAGGQSAERPLMQSYRTQLSRSVFSLECHTAGWLIDIRYRPTPEPAHTRAFNSQFGTKYPEDLPLDCVGLLMHFDNALTLEELKESVVPGLPREEQWRILAVGALLHESTALDAWLQCLPQDLQRAGLQTAWTYNHLGYLLRRALEHTDLYDPLQSEPYSSSMVPSDMIPDDEDEDDEEEDG